MSTPTVGVATVSVRPYHETIIDAIQRCRRGSCPESAEDKRLFILIKETAIPKGHEDAVLVALKTHFPCNGCNGGECKAARQAAEESILAQQAASAQKT